ncbi:substrate-binding domain-containing protein [Streptomyces sp. NBC_00198]|uniref:substrate-binding domain-containing protein n=1 Tax=Streptomyces sp. NBC_00198 TaxID=2975677 RepID=UPI00225412CC|nr:substrate-binding domain-containing protein [Streptomyces sp. NBC_00198]MCX5285378.1 substrate-binding domain-containing protein [Streptomyces sp. NBC_00198]
MITLAVPELDVAYFSELAKHVMAAADRRGCTVLIHATGSRRDRELSALNGFDAQFTDGVILSALTLRQRDLDHHEKHLPVVPLGERHTPGSLDHVGIDNIAAAREASAHLLARGRRRIAVVGGSLRGRQGTDRLRTIGYAEALKAAGLPFDGDLVAPRGTPNTSGRTVYIDYIGVLRIGRHSPVTADRVGCPEIRVGDGDVASWATGRHRPGPATGFEPALLS